MEYRATVHKLLNAENARILKLSSGRVSAVFVDEKTAEALKQLGINTRSIEDAKYEEHRRYCHFGSHDYEVDRETLEKVAGIAKSSSMGSLSALPTVALSDAGMNDLAFAQRLYPSNYDRFAAHGGLRPHGLKR